MSRVQCLSLVMRPNVHLISCCVIGRKTMHNRRAGQVRGLVRPFYIPYTHVNLSHWGMPHVRGEDAPQQQLPDSGLL